MNRKNLSKQSKNIYIDITSTNKMHNILNRSLKFYFWYLQVLILVVKTSTGTVLTLICALYGLQVLI